MSKCELRACCKRPEGAVYSLPDAPRDKHRDGSPAAVITVLAEPPPPSEDIAYHEAAHAVAMHAFGAHLQHVTIAGQPQARGELAALDLAARIVVYLVGPSATDVYWRRTTTLFDHEREGYVERVDSMTMGDCDHCRAALVATVVASKTHEDRYAIFRDCERRANDFVRADRVRQAIRALAEELMQRSTISGKRAASVIEPHISFGEFARKETHV